MLVIRRQQIEALELGFARGAAPALAREIAAAFPAAARGRIQDEMARVVDAALVRAWRYGLRARVDLRTFAQLALCAAAHFDRHPPFQRIFTDPDAPSAGKLRRLFAAATADDWNAAAGLHDE